MTEKIEYIGKVALRYDYYSGQDFYEDGAEGQLLELVSNYDITQYQEVIAEKKDWAVLYHLSHVRGNVVDWIPFTKEDSVLEIGAGCGAITGTLARKAKKVDCIELSRKRSLVNATRNKEYDNIQIQVGNFQDIEPNITEKYDYITLIGVLEYAASYIKSERPYEEFLNIIKKHLKEDGRIVIAIENKYGLKYWAGCREDHLGTFYSGIEGYCDTSHVKTFSKNGLNQLFATCGLEHVEYYYPYPDYKLPMAVYSDDFMPKAGSLNQNNCNFDNDRMMVFNETKVFDSLIEDGMFDVFSNSYVILAGTSKAEHSGFTGKIFDNYESLSELYQVMGKAVYVPQELLKEHKQAVNVPEPQPMKPGLVRRCARKMKRLLSGPNQR